MKTGDYTVSYEFKASKNSMFGKGLFSPASGKNHGPQEVFDLYRFRGASEVKSLICFAGRAVSARASLAPEKIFLLKRMRGSRRGTGYISFSVKVDCIFRLRSIEGVRRTAHEVRHRP